MKKCIMSIAMALAVSALAGCEDGSYLNPNTVQIHSDSVSRIESAGQDLRVYEFTPRHRSDLDCIFVSGSKKGGLVCTPKITQQPE